MLILLPPSEGKTVATRGRPLDLGRLSFPELSQTRAAVAQAVADVSLLGDAATRLGVSPNLTAEIARNTRLLTAPTAAAGRVYSGVLYEALDVASLDPAARRRANRWLLVVSALFGAVRMGDHIPAYRLSMAVNLPPLGPLASAWRGPLAAVLPGAAGRGVIVDCRSSTYAGAWVPQGPLAQRWVQIRVPGATHLAKYTRGLVARHLCRVGAEVRTPSALADVVGLRFDVELSAPTRTGAPWILDATAR
ncbi:YaaA family protein [Lapillicoccus sp.]|uniref:YaaA family protein n=1 Tax=Lapillicoccus sp. TaxID=1909287 RepID=UPI003983AFD2